MQRSIRESTLRIRLCAIVLAGSVLAASVPATEVTGAPATISSPLTGAPGTPPPASSLPVPGTAPSQSNLSAPTSPSPAPIQVPTSAPSLPNSGGVIPVSSLPVSLDDPDDPSLIDQTQWLLLSESVEQAGREREILRAYGLQLRGRALYPSLQMVVSRFVLTPPDREEPLVLLARLQQEHPDLTLEFNRLYVPLQSAVLDDRIQSARSSPERYGQVLIGLDKRCRTAQTPVTVAMLDGQVNTMLPEFEGSSITSVDVTRQGAAPSHHATAIAALLAGQGEQALLSGANLLTVTVFAPNDQGQLLTRTEWLLAGLEHLMAAQPRPAVANLSFGGPDSRLLTPAFQRVAADILLVAAAGNQGEGHQPTYPARLPDVIAVTAVDPDARLYALANQGEALEFAAPGVDIYSVNAQGQATYMTGTSLAAPWVTAAATRLATAAADESGAQRRSRLQAMTLDLGEAGRDSEFGYGLVDMSVMCQH